MKGRGRWLAAAVLSLSLVAAACGDSNGDGGGGDAPDEGGGASDVTIDQFAFAPDSVTVSVGDTVTWSNAHSGVPHTSTSDDDLWNSGTLNTGDEFSFTFDEAGTFTYFCSIHPSMTASITVG